MPEQDSDRPNAKVALSTLGNQLSDAPKEELTDLDAAWRTIAALREHIAEQDDRQRHESDMTRENLDKALKQIEQAHQEWITALDAIDDPVFVHDHEFRIVRANRAYQQRTGIPFVDFIGRPYYEFFPKSDGPMPSCFQEIQGNYLSNGANLDEEIEIDGRTYRSRAFSIQDDLGKFLFSVHAMEDVTERKQHELAMQRTNRALRTISAGNQALIRAADEASLLIEMCEIAVKYGGYRMAWIGYARDDASKTIEQMAQTCFEKKCPNLKTLTWSDSEQTSSPAGDAIIHSETRVVQDIQKDSSCDSWQEQAASLGYASCIALPLREGERAFGVMLLFDEKLDVFDEDEVEMLEEMAGDLAFGILTLRLKIAHRAHEQRLQSNMLKTVEAIAGIVDMRDPYTSGHQRRVAGLAEAIARKMGMTEEERQAIQLAGIVHDLGKIKIPAEILSKPGRLNEMEYNLIKMHPQAGYEILKVIEFSWPVAEMVYQHHERMDGTGYPQGIKGDEFLLGARILAVADVMEAMSSHRPYRPGLGIDSALDELSKGRGTIYDAQVVDVCTALFREDGYELA